MAEPPREIAGGYSAVDVEIWRDGTIHRASDHVAEEVPVSLVYNGEPHVVMMATPRDLEDFALGFSVSEDIVATPDELDVLQVTPLTGDAGVPGYEVSMRIPQARHEALSNRRRNLQGRTGCGLCGAQTIADAIRLPRRVPAGVVIHADALKPALEAIRKLQTINIATGATHAAAWVTPDGRVAALYEDVGRHNALDKLIGYCLRTKQDLARGFLVITSRASYEMVLKAATVGIPLVAAISAPTAYAVRLAEEAALTLIGFARGDRHVVYACPGRLSSMSGPKLYPGKDP